MKVAVFVSSFVGGGVCLWYCPHGRRYEFRYTVQFRTLTGFSDFMASCAYDAVDIFQVADFMLDAIDIVCIPLLEGN